MDLLVLLDSKDLFTSLPTKRNSIDKSIYADVNITRLEFECGKVNESFWIPGSVNLADPGTKANSPLIHSLQLLLFKKSLPIIVYSKENQSRNNKLGLEIYIYINKTQKPKLKENEY